MQTIERKPKRPDYSKPVYNPPPEEIAEQCRLIREGWSRDEEHRRRAGMVDES